MTQTRGTPLGSLIIDEQVSTSAGVELYLGRQPALDRWVSVRKLPAEQRQVKQTALPSKPPARAIPLMNKPQTNENEGSSPLP